VTGGSIAFDRAAEFYDRSRAITDEAMARTIEVLAQELAGRRRVLEVGVGTGLLGLPLHGRGFDLIGLDLSLPMLRKLISKAGGSGPFPLVRGDATRMPFGEGRFGGAYLRWVLHLIPSWRAALVEVVRVVRPGGVFLAQLGGYPVRETEIRRRFEELTGASTSPVGIDSRAEDELDAAMADLGASIRILQPIVHTGEEALAEFLDGIEDGRYSWTWRVPEDGRRAAARELRTWAQERFGPLDVRMPYRFETTWRAYDLP
jgi:SAM-dependent methyltransferase